MRTQAAHDRAIAVMGVAGSGKSTLGAALARHFAREFRDGDSFHDIDNVAKMARGEPLTSADRGPWLDAIAAWLTATPRGIVVCSALAHSYRDRLRHAGPLLIIYLAITPSTARCRVANRQEHFMPVSLVDDQCATLESPSSDERDVVQLDAEARLTVLIARALSAITGARIPNTT